MNGASAGAPLFILSFRHRDELAAAAARAGWHALAARRSERIAERFVASGARVALLDIRGAPAEGLTATAELADAVEATRGALLVLVPRDDLAVLERLLAAGATHYLAGPCCDDELGHALGFAWRHVERLDQKRGPGRSARQAPAWRWRRGMRLVEMEPAARRLLGLPAAEPLTRGRLLARLDAPARRTAIQAIAGVREEGSGVFAHASGEHPRIVHHLSAAPADNGVIGRIEIIADGRAGAGTSERDALTGLANAVTGRRRLAAQLAGGGANVLLVGLSRFDAINDAFGQAVGDALLAAVGRRIAAVAARHPGTAAARVAGTEFLLVLPAGFDAALVADALVAALGRPFVSGDHLVPLAARIGLARGVEGEEADQLLQRASTALTEARDGDGDRVRIACAPAEAAAASSLEVDLRRALDERRIEILFQPQVEIASGRIVGVEALARWRHPEKGEIDAPTLFRVAARSDYMLALSRHVQERALESAAAWPDHLAGLRLAINVTAADLAEPAFAAQLAAAIRLTGLDPRRITVELTEESLVEDLAAAARALAALRAGGLSTAADDFGTGYSSLAYLKALPLDYIKIDRSLVRDIGGATRDRVVVRGLIDMARSLDLMVVAEGVETEEQLAQLAAAGCTLYQGFLCAPPLTGAALAELVAREPR